MRGDMRSVLIGRWHVIPVAVIGLLGFLFSILLSWLYFDLSYFEPDTVSYLFQAKLFASGKLCLPAPPEYGFSPSPHINILNGKWYSKYPFGNALMLTLGVLMGTPWLIPAIMTGLALWLLYLMVSESYGRRTALLAAILGLISPATLGMGATWFSEPVSRFYLGLFLLGLLKMVKSGRWFYAPLSGFALGYAFNTRPVPAVAFGICGGVFLLCHLIRSAEKIHMVRLTASFLIPFSLMIGLTMAWNWYFTDNPLKFTHNAAQPYDRIGFGKRGEGYDPDLKRAFRFTPRWALERIWRHTIPCVSLNALGWGYYRPDLFRSYRSGGERFLTMRVIPLSFPIILMFLPLLHRSRNRYDLFFISLFLMNLLIYSFFYFEGSTWGITPVNARYYAESTLLGIIPLVARGIIIVYGYLGSLGRRMPRWGRISGIAVILLVLCALIINTVHSYMLFAQPFRNWSKVYQALPRLVEKRRIHNAVIFISRSRNAPIGSYPFEPLGKADIVYFKLGPSKVWRLTNSDWRKVYRRYFNGRRAYIYEGGKLRELNVAAP
jgi:4-amino-4-deoxy-L-arabinose transferase-like glycosyltransferase